MRAPLLRDVHQADSWLTRVRDNLGQLLIPAALAPHSANGAPLHLLKFDRTARSGRAQMLSLLAHIGILAAILAIAAQIKHQRPTLTWPDGSTPIERLLYSPPPSQSVVSKPSLGKRGGGGENDRVLATHGFFAPNSAIPLAPPRLPDNHTLPVPAAVPDMQAPVMVIAVNELGIPSMPKDTNSAGSGKEHGIGSGRNGGMGDRDGQGAGFGDEGGIYANGASLPACSYCPLPVYTDEARQVKVQGTVTLRVLVGADGRASQIRVVRGLGYGLEERAVQTVGGWKFNPALDASHRPAAAWITIEAVFRLF
jgi:protein TonB